MGHVQIADDVHARSIRLPGFQGTVRIELDREEPRIVVPATIEVVREPNVDSLGESAEGTFEFER